MLLLLLAAAAVAAAAAVVAAVWVCIGIGHCTRQDLHPTLISTSNTDWWDQRSSDSRQSAIGIRRLPVVGYR